MRDSCTASPCCHHRVLPCATWRTPLQSLLAGECSSGLSSLLSTQAAPSSTQQDMAAQGQQRCTTRGFAHTQPTRQAAEVDNKGATVTTQELVFGDLRFTQSAPRPTYVAFCCSIPACGCKWVAFGARAHACVRVRVQMRNALHLQARAHKCVLSVWSASLWHVRCRHPRRAARRSLPPCGQCCHYGGSERAARCRSGMHVGGKGGRE